MISENKYTKRVHLPQKHLFESATTYSLYDEGFVNLTAGAPGPDLLEQCCKIFQVATRHRMVCIRMRLSVIVRVIKLSLYK